MLKYACMFRVFSLYLTKFGTKLNSYKHTFNSLNSYKSAKKELEKLPKTVIPKVIYAVEKLASEPFPAGSKKLIGTETTHRIRIGDYRILYRTESNRLIIEVIKVAHRKNVYKHLR